jgi:hypothetical protein
MTRRPASETHIVACEFKCLLGKQLCASLPCGLPCGGGGASACSGQLLVAQARDEPSLFDAMCVVLTLDGRPELGGE